MLSGASGPVQQPGVLHSLGLSGGELREARVVRVVHVVVDRVESGGRAGIPAGLATERGGLLGGRIGDEVTALVALAEERVLEVEPVAGLVDERVALVVQAGVLARGAGHGLPVDHDAVEVGLGGIGDVGQVGVAEVAAAAGRVDVHGVVAAGLERRLHGVLGTGSLRGVPRRVVRAIDAIEDERKARVRAAVEAAVGPVHLGDLGLELRIGEAAGRAAGDDVEEDRHADGHRCGRLALGRRRHVVDDLAGVLLADRAAAVREASPRSDAATVRAAGPGRDSLLGHRETRQRELRRDQRQAGEQVQGATNAGHLAPPIKNDRPSSPCRSRLAGLYSAHLEGALRCGVEQAHSCDNLRA